MFLKRRQPCLTAFSLFSAVLLAYTVICTLFNLKVAMFDSRQKSFLNLALSLYSSNVSSFSENGSGTGQNIRLSRSAGKSGASTGAKPVLFKQRSFRMEELYDLSVREQDLNNFMFSTNCSTLPLNFFEGRMKISKVFVPEEKLTKSLPDMKDGHYSPKNCTPHENVAIIIPFRDRLAHLFILLPTLIPMLIKQGVQFTIFVIEQDLPTSFNKGVVYNAGFLEALKVDNFDCFIFHDVDMLPLNNNNLYRCDPKGPLHFVAGVNKFKYRLIYNWLIGGVLGLTRDQYQRVNGFSNLYFGWGSEDDDMRLRMYSTNMTVYRRPQSVGLYDMIIHRRDKRWRPNNGRFEITWMATNRTHIDGINTVKYTLTSMEKKPLFIHMRIAVNMADVYNVSEKVWLTSPTMPCLVCGST
ncbi:hypothetical protein EGW08_022154 [Elysia chlorotica]|uniref:Beta-1,4-galactosyltransferase n=1 Tax=Elysia chlorotica TaxID=188477 RepID=A0A433SLR9_ELYCH|nr:hypothetical protein EGW08_022154 [Elysia chlorotica]